MLPSKCPGDPALPYGSCVHRCLRLCLFAGHVLLEAEFKGPPASEVIGEGIKLSPGPAVCGQGKRAVRKIKPSLE